MENEPRNTPQKEATDCGSTFVAHDYDISGMFLNKIKNAASNVHFFEYVLLYIG